MIVGLSQRAGRPFTRRWLRLAGPPHTTQIAWSLSTISRSEEHTSELQSPCNLVCRLLLEKKKTIHLPAPWVDDLVLRWGHRLLRMHERARLLPRPCDAGIKLLELVQFISTAHPTADKRSH